MSRQRLAAPAKVNLMLLVGPLQPDGYHPLLSVMAPLQLADEIEIDLAARPMEGSGAAEDQARGRPETDMRAAGVTIICSGVAEGMNLADRALGVLEQESRWRFEGEVVIHKRIPVAAGMGGGSSDAATVLQAGAAALAASGGPTLGSERLAELGLALGADIPFFLTSGPHMARGRGEQLDPFALPGLPLVLVFPDESLSTRAVYSMYDQIAGREAMVAFEERARRARAAWEQLQTDWLEGTLGEAHVPSRVAALAENDLERAACRMVSALRRRRMNLKSAGAVAALISGSGPTMFGIFPNYGAAACAGEKLAAQGHRVAVTETGAGFRSPRVPLP